MTPSCPTRRSSDLRYFYKVTPEAADDLIDDLRNGRRAHEVPKHGTLARVRQQIPQDRRAGNAVPGESEEPVWLRRPATRSEEHTSELQSLMRISYAVFCLKKQTTNNQQDTN